MQNTKTGKLNRYEYKNKEPLRGAILLDSSTTLGMTSRGRGDILIDSSDSPGIAKGETPDFTSGAKHVLVIGSFWWVRGSGWAMWVKYWISRPGLMLILEKV